MIPGTLIGTAVMMAGMACVAPAPDIAGDRCSCIRHDTPEEQFEAHLEQADVVVHATVISVDTLGGPVREGAGQNWGPGDPTEHPIVATLEIHRGWKGEPVETLELRMGWVVGWATSCDQRWNEGDEIILFGREVPDTDGQIQGRYCSGTTEIDRAIERGDLGFLGSPKWVPEAGTGAARPGGTTEGVEGGL
jgi:hypothetical protein